MNRPSSHVDDWSVTLHSSWTGIMLNALGGLLFLAVATYLVSSVGLTVITGLVLFIAVVAVVVLALDMPIAATFSEDGIERRAALRQHQIEWSQVTRMRRGRAGIIRNRKQNESGGLVATVGSRPYVLTDRMESQIEFDQIRDGYGHDRSDAVGMDYRIRPIKERPPTWSYRRQKWRPHLD